MQKKLRKTMKSLWKDRALIVMTLPATIYLILFAFIPMTGVVLAFKKFDFSLGLYGSPWVGLKNFRMLFISSDMFWRLTRNTVGYFLLHTAIGLVCNVSLAIALNELVFKRSAKYMQSIMIMPTFISYIAVAYIVEALLSAKNGMITKALADAGMGRVNFYLEAGLWPLILTIVKIWKDTGYGSVLYLSVLTGIDQEIYDAAAIDGASGWKKIRYITVPLLVPMMTVMTLLSVGGLMHSNTGLFYQVTKNTGALYKTTQVLDSYILDAIMSSTDYTLTATVSFYQSVVGCLMVIISNLVVKKISPENSLF